jgi:hypothetical protein
MEHLYIALTGTDKLIIGNYVIFNWFCIIYLFKKIDKPI